MALPEQYLHILKGTLLKEYVPHLPELLGKDRPKLDQDKKQLSRAFSGFALHKLLISGRRHSDKAERDREQAVAVVLALQAAGDDARLRSIFASLPARWKAQIKRAVDSVGELWLSDILG